METKETGPVAELRDRLQATLRGSYTLQRELGGGGMSRVFVAEDARLGRLVVVKVLHPDLASGVSAQRFEREILLAARLQHPHIVPFLSAGEVDGLPYYMMPFVEGETLRARFARDGSLPVGDALRLVRELADALAYAHGRGVMHRDLKPENVLLSGGHAVIADFGVAKALASATLDGTTGGSGATTGATAATGLGVAVGTPAYMAPEQAAADPAADHRVDLYALGLIAYEALAGVHPFAGRAPSEMLAAQLTQVPAPLAQRRQGVPRAAATLVTRLLAKRPDDRPASAADVVRALDEVTTPAEGTLGIRSSRRTRVITAVGLAAFGAAAVLWWMRSKAEVAERTPLSRAAMTRRPLTFTGAAQEPEFSRDGRQIVYVEHNCATGRANRGACADTLRVMDFHSGQSEPLTNARIVLHPHWSADGAWIAVLMMRADGEGAGELGTYVVPSRGGVPRRLAPPSLAEFVKGGDTLLIATTHLSGGRRFVRRVRASTGGTLDSTPLPPSLNPLEGFHASPDRKWLALRLANQILLATPDHRVTDSLNFENAGSLRWGPRGDALYAVKPGTGNDSRLMRVGIDAALGRFIGHMETVLPLGPSAGNTFDIAPDGRTLVHTGGTLTTTQWTLDLDARPAKPRQLGNSTQWLGFPSLSADGELVAYDATDDAGENVYVQPFAGGPRRPITRDSRGWGVVGWIPGTKRLIYADAEMADTLYAHEIPDGPRRVLGKVGILPLADGGTVALQSSQRKVVFRTVAGAERVVSLPDSLGPILDLRSADVDGGGAYVTTLRDAGSERQHGRWVRVDRASGALGVVVDLASQQSAAFLAADHGDVVYATWAVGAEVARPTLWRGRSGTRPVKLAELSLECSAGWLTMSRSGRRFACLEMTSHPDLIAFEHFDDRR